MSDTILQKYTPITSFDQLPSEIILDIFDYLSPHDILHSFVDLSPRLRQLILKQHHVLNPFHLSTNNPHFWHRVLPLIESHIQSLIMVDGHLVEWLDLFTHLTSLTASRIGHIGDSKAFARLRTLKIKDETTAGWPIHESQLDAEQILFRAVLSDANQLEVFEYAPKLGSLKRRTLYGLARNASIGSLTLHLHEFADVFTILEFTPNLRSLRLQSLPPCFEDVYERDDTFAIELRELHLKFDPLKTGPIGSCFLGVDFHRIIRTVLKFSASLLTLSLNFVDLNKIRPRDDLPFNGATLTNELLSVMVKLENFALYARKVCKEHNVHQVLSTFQTEFWSDRHWTIGVHQHCDNLYIYTLPFQFGELRDFTDFSGFVVSHRQVLQGSCRLWLTVTSLELLVSNRVDLKEVFRSIKFHMPKLTSIKFIGDEGRRDNSFVLIDRQEHVDTILRSVTTVHLQGIPIDAFKRYFIDVLPRVRHLTLSGSALPSPDDELTTVLGKRIRRLELGAYYDIRALTESSYSYLTSLEELCLIFNYASGEIHSNGRAKVIVKVFENSPGLKILLIYAVPCAGCFIYSVDQLFQPVLDKLDAGEINKTCEIKRYGQYLRFTRR